MLGFSSKCRLPGGGNGEEETNQDEHRRGSHDGQATKDCDFDFLTEAK
jgi:hypothetical protein